MEKFFNIGCAGQYDPYNDTIIFGNDLLCPEIVYGKIRLRDIRSSRQIPERQKMRDWMRSPHFVSAADEWQNRTEIRQ